MVNGKTLLQPLTIYYLPFTIHLFLFAVLGRVEAKDFLALS